uniref:AAA+ ATPase domain-containing protein n=1 Tax=Fagus sylvatica TaxID=28930 RepID=A0A2N9IHJ5_FAGSY
MEIVISIAAKVVEYTVAPVVQWLGYSFRYSSNMENVKKQEEKLQDARERVQHSVDAAINNAEKIETDVNRWLENVDFIMGKVKEVIEVEEKVKMRCSNGACLNLKQRHQQSKKAKKILQDIEDVLQNGKFDKVSYRDASQGIVTTSSMDYMNFESRMSTMNQLMETLRASNINIIGVWGMAGVGKSTLVREVAKKVKEERLFDEVAIAIVKQNPDQRRIQGEIADKLDLDLKLAKETLSGRADLLRERLTQDKNKKILIILDDIWEKLDLDEIGIPRQGCKVVVTSRDRDILSSQMDTEKNFGLYVLPKEEAWSLFEKFSGDSLKDSNLRSRAIEVSTACAGLPLALVTVAKALKNKSLFEWEDALQQLRRPSPRHQKRMQEIIYSAIELSYNHLESPELQSFFLLCAEIKIGSNIYYMDLLKKCFGLRLFHGTSTLEATRNRICTLVRGLKDSGLLLDTPGIGEYFQMHDLAHDAALLIAYKTQNVLAMKDEGPVEWPDEDDIKMCTIISILQRDIHELPDKLECPDLRCLYLPSEIGLLTRLRMLDLSNCTKLEVIPSNVLSRLIQLEELYVGNSFTQWEVEGLNNERASLAELKHLSQLTTLEVHIPDANMLPKDLLLEKLKMWDWSDKHENSRALKLKLNTSFQLESGIKMLLNGIEDLCLDELKGVESIIYELDTEGFQQLKHLHVQNNVEIKYIINPRLVIDDVVFPALEMVSLKNMINLEEICHGQLPLTSFHNLRIVKVEHCEKLKFVFSSSIAKGLSQLQELEIRECSIMGAIVLKEEAGVEDRDMILLPQLRHLVLHRLPKLMSFLSTQKSIRNDAGEIIPECDLDFHMPILLDQVAFPSLETLEISHMENLKIIWHNQLAEDSFFKLQLLVVEFCENVMNIFQSNMLTRFQSLEKLFVYDCGSLQEIFELQGQDFRETHVVTTIPLKNLDLRRLPKMKQVWNKDPQGIFSFQNLQEIYVDECESLKSLFPASVARCLMQLEDLQIFDCGVEEIVAQEDGAEAAARLVFPKVTTMCLCKLPKLKWFYQGVHTSKWPLLKTLEVYGCDQIEICPLKKFSFQETIEQSQAETSLQHPLFLVDEATFPNLEDLVLGGNYNMKEILLGEFLEECFGKLKYLGVVGYLAVSNWITFLKRLHNLEKLLVEESSWEEIFPYEELFAKSLVQLKKLSVSECESITEVVAGEGGEGNEVITFSQLTYLKLDCLPNLTSFCSRSYSFEFPSLEEVIVSKCPEMKIFCHGILSTPKLERVQATKEDEWHWKVDLEYHRAYIGFGRTNYDTTVQ